MIFAEQLTHCGRSTMGMIPHISEKRHYSRFSVHLEVGFTIVDENTSARITAYHPAILVNRSQGGCCLMVKERQVSGFDLRKCVESVKLYYILISLGGRRGDEQPFELKGFVRWIHGVGEEGKDGFIIGLELVPPSDESGGATGRARVVGHS